MGSYMSMFLYVVGGVTVAGVALLVAFQDKLVYVPVLPGLTRSYAITPARFGLPYEDVWLTSSDGIRLHSWYIKPFSDNTGPTLLFFQENAGNIAHRLEMVSMMLQRLHCNIFMLSYRGYGDSDGFPSQQGIIRDAQAALDHLVSRTDINASKIVVFGRSLGGAVGATLAQNNPDKVAALILENTFTSILDMAGILLPFLKYFIGKTSCKGIRILNFVVRSPWNTIDVIGKVKQPVLFLSGLRDEMVPPSHMELLYAKAATHNQQCTFVEFPSGMHMDTWLVGGDRYWRTILEFFQKHVQNNDNESSAAVFQDRFSRMRMRGWMKKMKRSMEKPYAEHVVKNYASDEFWICCDICERWVHGKCVKITPARAEHIKQYRCPSCSNKRHQGGCKLSLLCVQIMASLCCGFLDTTLHVCVVISR